MGISRKRASTQWVHRRRNHHSFPSGRRGTCRHRYHGFRPGHHCRRRQEWTLRGCSRKSLDMRYGIDFACKHAGRRWTYAVVGESARVARDIRACHGASTDAHSPTGRINGNRPRTTCSGTGPASRQPFRRLFVTLWERRHQPPRRPPRGQQIRRRAPHTSWALPMRAVPIP